VTRSIRWHGLARNQGIVRFTQCAVTLTTAAIALPALAAITTTAASASPARSVPHAVSPAVKVKATIPVSGGGPVSVATNPVTDTVYVTASENGICTVSVINGHTNAVAGTITMGTPATGFEPTAVVVNARTDTIYVSAITAAGGVQGDSHDPRR
jgi:DNA-binding beta-propeller fold protein YncE